ncbi:MAG: DUF2500 domain-containing protein [Oscillospiraceae bacterium]|nr:DUF2500 domain-containing protein [Oscillospiraceae bacterium]
MYSSRRYIQKIVAALICGSFFLLGIIFVVLFLEITGGILLFPVCAYGIGLTLFSIITIANFRMYLVLKRTPTLKVTAKTVSKTTQLISRWNGAVYHHITFERSDSGVLKLEVGRKAFNAIAENVSGTLEYKARKGRLFFVDFRPENV